MTWRRSSALSLMFTDALRYAGKISELESRIGGGSYYLTCKDAFIAATRGRFGLIFLRCGPQNNWCRTKIRSGPEPKLHI
jgi:hypothetical protein